MPNPASVPAHLPSWHCHRCGQQFLPGQPAPWCIGGKYQCDTSMAVRIEPPPPAWTPPPTEPFPAPTLVEAVPDDVDTRVAELRAWAAELGRMPGRDAVKARFVCGSSTANRLREQAGGA